MSIARKRLEDSQTKTDPSTQLTREISPIVQQAKGLMVINRETCELAIEVRDRIRDARKKVKEVFGGIVEAAHLAHKKAKEQFNKFDNPLVEADDILKRRVGDYVRGQEAIKGAERGRLQLEAEQKAIEKAEQERIDAAMALAETGRADEAAELVSQPIYVEPVKTVRVENDDLPKVDKRYIRENYRGRVFDLRKLVDAISSGKVPLQAVEGNEQFLNQQAKAFKDTEALNYPGVEVVME